jgi:hypothetical protein
MRVACTWFSNRSALLLLVLLPCLHELTHRLWNGVHTLLRACQPAAVAAADFQLHQSVEVRHQPQIASGVRVLTYGGGSHTAGHHCFILLLLLLLLVGQLLGGITALGVHHTS